MKKFLIVALFIAGIVSAKAQTTTTSYINYPNGKASIAVLNDTASTTLTVTNNVLYAWQNNLGTSADTAKSTLTVNLTIGSFIKPGSLIYIEWKSGNVARSLTLGTGCIATTITSTASKRKVVTLLYNGTAYRVISSQLID